MYLCVCVCFGKSEISASMPFVPSLFKIKMLLYKTTYIEISLFIFFTDFVCMCDIQAKVETARQALTEVTKCNTELLLSMTNLSDERKELEQKLNTRQKKMVISVEQINFTPNINQSWDKQEDFHLCLETVEGDRFPFGQ